MSSMEEIIEIFANSISGFILLSLKLQEANAQPQAALRPAAEAVVQTSKGLVEIARAKAIKEYIDYVEIQEDMLDCVKRVEEATNSFGPALDSLFSSSDRKDGWRRLVNATQGIASQTSRLLLVVFGAEHRRLQAAGLKLLDTCARNKAFALMVETDLQQRGKDVVETTNKNSSDLMVFNGYVQARAKEVEGPKSRQMTDAVAAFNRLNNELVNGCNEMLKAITKETRAGFIKPIGDIEKLTRAILDLLTPPEDSDIFALVESLYSQRATGGTLYAQTPLGEAALRLKKELQPLKPSSVTPGAARTAADRTDRAAADFAGLARAKVAGTSDAERRARMQKNLAAIEAERKNVNQASAKFVANPGANTVGVMNNAARQLEALVDEFMLDVKPEATMAVPGNGAGLNCRLEAIDQAAANAREAVAKVKQGVSQGNMGDNEMAAAGDDASKKLAKLIEHLRARVAANNDDSSELKAFLQDKIRALQGDNKQLVQTVNGYIHNRDAKQPALSTCDKTIADIDSTMNKLVGANKQKKARTFEDKIDAAADNIRDAADEYSLLPKQLKELSTKLADLMAKLAQCARDGDRQGIIETARSISDVVKEIRSQTKALAANCRDPQLKDNILTASTAMSNFGTQLKIIASVKAASVGKDPAAENQLVSCCEGLSTNVRAGLYNCQSAKQAGKA